MDIEYNIDRNDHKAEYYEEAILLLSSLIKFDTLRDLQVDLRTKLIDHVEMNLKANYPNSADFEKEMEAPDHKGLGYHKYKPQVVVDTADYLLANVELSDGVKEKLTSIRKESALAIHSQVEDDEALLKSYLGKLNSDLAPIKAKHALTYPARLAKACDALRKGESPIVPLKELGLSDKLIQIVELEIATRGANKAKSELDAVIKPPVNKVDGAALFAKGVASALTAPNASPGYGI